MLYSAYYIFLRIVCDEVVWVVGVRILNRCGMSGHHFFGLRCDLAMLIGRDLLNGFFINKCSLWCWQVHAYLPPFLRRCISCARLILPR